MCLCMGAGTGVHQWPNIKCLPLQLSTVLFEPGSLTEPGAQHVSKASLPSRLRDPPVPAFPELELEACAVVTALYVDIEDPNLGLHAV